MKARTLVFTFAEIAAFARYGTNVTTVIHTDAGRSGAQNTSGVALSARGSDRR